MTISFFGGELATTGPRARGLTHEQRREFVNLLNQMRPSRIHNGAAEGCDTEVLEVLVRARICRHVTLYPTNAVRREEALDILTGNGMEIRCYPITAPLARNREMAKTCDILVAFPDSAEPAARSGTWATIRAAQRDRKFVILILPNGTVINNARVR